MGVVDDQESEQLLGPDPKAEEEEEAKVGDKSDTCSEIVLTRRKTKAQGLKNIWWKRGRNLSKKRKRRRMKMMRKLMLSK